MASESGEAQTSASTGNPKHEILNPKQYQMTKAQNLKVLILGNLNLEFVSDLEIRI